MPPRAEALSARLHVARLSTGATIGAGVVVWCLLLAPVVALARHLSGAGIHSTLQRPDALEPLRISLEAAAIVVVVLVVVTGPFAYLLARRRLPWPWLWEAVVLLALMMPPLVIGLLLIFVIGPLTPFGHGLSHIHLSATNTFLGLVIAELYESAPYFILGAQSAFESVDRRLEEQAAMLGDRPARVLRRVTLPQAAPGLALAFATAWARAIGAYGAVMIVAYHPYGLPMIVYVTLQESGLASALPYAALLLIVALPLPLLAYAWTARVRRTR